MEAAGTVREKREHVRRWGEGGQDTAKGSLRDSVWVRGKARNFVEQR